ncbi:MAG: 5-oxoprolinase subunit PxpA [Verrucomicrobiota bacterium]
MGAGGMGLKDRSKARDVLELNCDLGEGEPPEQTAALCGCVRRINVACGVHAGDDASMARCVDLARRHGLKLGAHPGAPGSFGRGSVHPTPAGLMEWVAPQVARVAAHATHGGMRLVHVKLHGSLYHAVEGDGALACAFARWAKDELPGVELLGLHDGALVRAAREAGVPFVPEGFLDRGYLPDGRLVPRGQCGAVRSSKEEVAGRVARWLATGTVEAVDGSILPLDVKTWCVHGDSPGILEAIHGVA